jgi:hypothetical protein
MRFCIIHTGLIGYIEAASYIWTDKNNEEIEKLFREKMINGYKVRNISIEEIFNAETPEFYIKVSDSHPNSKNRHFVENS